MSLLPRIPSGLDPARLSQCVCHKKVATASPWAKSMNGQHTCLGFVRSIRKSDWETLPVV